MEVGKENLIRSTLSVATNSLGEPFICHSTANQISSKGIWFGDDPLLYSLPIFLLQLFLMFIFTHFFYIILKPFGQPAVVSQILGGMTLGPSILGHSATFSEKVFPLKERSVLDTMTFFGFMLFIFLSGILNSEIGRMAASSSLVAEACFIVNMTLTFFIKLSLTKSIVVSIGSFLSSLVLFLFVIYVVHPAALWAIQQSPEGKPVEEIYICAVLVTLMICGLLGEIIGINALVVSFFIGLAIPDGPPLGAALVDKLDCFVSVVCIPMLFIIVGLRTNVYAIQTKRNILGIQLIICTIFCGKILGALLPLLYLRMPIRDAFALGFIMNIKGTVEMALLITLKLKDVVNDECFTIMVLNLLFVSGIVSPIVKSLYDPSRRFLAYKRRTLMHHNNDEQLRILACIHKQENVLGILNLLSASNPTKESPIDLVVLQLIKLVGRSSSVLVAHVPCKKFGELPTLSEQIFNSFDKFEDAYKGKITIHSYKGISPYATMHNDVCYLALEKRTTFIILPFHKRWIFGRTTESSFPFQQINKHVLEKAPCSVGVLIDRGNQKMFWCGHTKESTYHVAVFFFGGADDRETLAYAKRMLDQPYVYITLFHFSSSTDIVGGTERSKMLDTEILSEFRLKAFRNERVSFKDEMITTGRDLLSVVEYMESYYDLVLVGRKHGDSKVMSELNKWKNGELGVVGEILVSLNVGAQTSILVVQQQTRYWGSRNPEDSIRKV
ncbi:cation/H(+) antiporter 15 isoform X2 [Vigna angularis]|uniref:cation/H(+) antiporter 15 isoform X2 n=1 Tax=Phaseolus angularis TaxID=3914 RepID=UPI000809EC90|nr:cation/H(+) antiporter 15 isoform X2 [Vigna angularis]